MTTTVNPYIDKANQSVIAAIPRAEADPTRPIFHFRPPANWMNDPNGPIYHNGWYHLFYQFNPFGDEWGFMHWGHTRSRDLVHWEHLPVALAPSYEQGEEHVFSGCAWHDGDGTPLLFYTSVKSGGKENRPPNEQWAARPLDDELMAWEKHPANPILALETHGGPAFDKEWRDPFIFAEAGRTFMVVGGDFVGGELDNITGVALYEAEDDSLLRWKYHKLLVQTTKDKLRFYECPNFFKVGDKWMLITSPYKTLEYMVGDFDVDTLKFTVEHEGILDPGASDVPNFYASNILFDKERLGVTQSETEQRRCILLGWVRGFPKDHGWNGALALPRILTIGEDGHPRQQPLPELAQLRSKGVDFGGQSVYGYGEIDHNFAAPSVEIEAKVKLSAACDVGIRLNRNRVVRYQVTGNEGKLTVVDTEIPLALGADRVLDLHVFIDRSVIEVFANGGKVAVTRLIDMPTDRCALKFYSDGSSNVQSLKAWEMQSIWE